MIDMIQKTGGIMTLEDLENYKVRVAPALQGTYRGRKVYTSHAPTSGPVLLHMLNLLEQYDLAGEGRTALNTHRLVEVLKCKYTIFTYSFDIYWSNSFTFMKSVSLRGMHDCFGMLGNWGLITP